MFDAAIDDSDGRRRLAGGYSPPVSPEAVTDADLEVLATRLERAELTGLPTPPLHEACSLRDAYRIQRELARRRRARGSTRVGWKVGATSTASQRFLGTDGPMLGPLFDDMRVRSGGSCQVVRMIDPRIEIELAFRIGPVPPAPDALAAAFEIVDSRIVAEGSDVRNAAADLGRACRFVLGSWTGADQVPDPQTLAGTLVCDGSVVASGVATTVLGDPRRSVAWLASMLDELGESLDPGDIVLSGSFIPPFPVEAGQTFDGVIEAPLGSVSVQFVEGE